MATLYGLNNNIDSSCKRLDYSIVTTWRRVRVRDVGIFYYDDGGYRVYRKQNPLVRISPNNGGYQTVVDYTIGYFGVAITDVTVIVRPDNSKVYVVGSFKPNSLAISNSRPDRTKQYYINILEPLVPNFSEI